MKIVNANPPNIEEIRARLTLTGGEIFCWGDTIYVPSGGDLSSWLIAHEAVHSRQQGNDIEGWWARYLDDPEFRFRQEVEAHQREYRVFAEGRRRPERRAFLRTLAKRLASPMYGRMCSMSRARKAIVAGAGV